LVISSPPPDKGLVTPPKQTQPSTSMIEMGQGDGAHNCSLLMSPPKKMKLTAETETTEIVEGESEVSPLKYVTAEGSVEQNETKCKRPVKLHIGYTTSSFKDCMIYLIIYEGNLKCRRNLYKEFCESNSSTNTSV
jgi:hypothetical protein